jgi:hypothetical protein
MENAAFKVFDNTKIGLLMDESNHKKYPISYYNVIDGEGLMPKKDCSYYSYMYAGHAILSKEGQCVLLNKGNYFSLNGEFSTHTITGCYKMIVIEVHHTKGVYPETNYRAMFHVGKVEKEGRLKYIDGCTDSLLIPPVKMGDPCFNHLHFPRNISQTPHTHPSHRIGIVSNGSGECVTPFGNLNLEEDMIFIIKEWDGTTFKKGLDGEDYEIGNHCFFTYLEAMDVIAFHPDSDFGATDINHPMINRTIVKGIPANAIDGIQTK